MIDSILALANDGWALLQTMPPWIYFLSMALLCILPVPISAFYLAAGPIYGIGTSLVWIGFAIALNQVAAYYLANGVMRPILERRLHLMGYSVPRIHDAGDQRLFTFLIRAVPGVPYALQNLMLGLAGIDWVRYLVISWPIQMLWAVAWLVAGDSAFEGRYGTMLAAIAMIAALALVGRWIGLRAKRMRADLALPTEPSTDEP